MFFERPIVPGEERGYYFLNAIFLIQALISESVQKLK